MRRGSAAPLREEHLEAKTSKLSLIALLCALCLCIPDRATSQVADEAALIATLHGPANDARQAAVALGRMGSAKGLAELVHGTDDYAIAQYGSGMSEAHRPVLPPDVEKVIAANFDRLTKSPYGNLADAVIDGSRYQSRELFELLFGDARRIIEIWKRAEQPGRTPDATFRALVKTDLPIGSEVIAFTHDIPSHPATSSARCALADYFRRHAEPPAIAALTALLRKSDDEDTAICVSSVLGAIATPESMGAILEEKKRLASTNAKAADRMLSSLIDGLHLLKPDAQIDLSPLREALPPPSEAPDATFRYLELVHHRKDKASRPLLVAYASAENVSDNFQHLVTQVLLEVGERDDWVRALDDVERAFRAKKIPGTRLKITESMLEPRIDPQGYQTRQAAAANEAYEAGKRADARLLDELIARGDAARIRDFIRGLRSADRPHIPPEVEHLVVAHFKDGELGRTLHGLVGPEEPSLKRSAYHGRELFDLFAEEMRRGSSPDNLKRILATDSPIEERLLALLKGRYLYTGACEIAKYLAAKRYSPAIPYLKRALEVGMSGETTNAGCPREALLAFGTQEALAAAATPDHYAADQRAPAAGEALRKLNALPPSTPVDFAEVRRAVGSPIPKSATDAYVLFAERRRPPEAIPDLLALMSESASGAALYEPALRALLAYDSPDVWKRTRQEVERLTKGGRIGRWAYDSAISQIDALLADPGKAIARRELERPHPADGELAKWDEPRLLTELQRLQGQSARDVAEILGEQASEKGLQALIQRRDLYLIGGFASGMTKTKASLNSGIESLVLANLGDEKLSGSLRNLIFGASYHDRRTFDHLADDIVRAKDPLDRAVIAPVLVKTDLPVEADVVSILGRLPAGPGETMCRCPIIRFLGERRYVAAVKPLADELKAGAPEMSRCIATALGKIGTADALEAVMERVRTLRADVRTAQLATWIEDEALASVKDVPRDAPASFLEAKRAKENRPAPTPAPLPPRPGEAPWEVVKALENDPAAHAAEVESRLDLLAARVKPGNPVDRNLVDAYLRLASILRFTLNDPERAISVYEKLRPLATKENGGLLTVDLGIADIDQFDRQRPAEAAEHLKKVLDMITALAASDTRAAGGVAEMTQSMTAWLREDIRFLETGKPFAGPLEPSMMGGMMLPFFLFPQGLGADPKLPPLGEILGGTDQMGRASLPTHDVLSKRLLSLPPSHAILFQTVGFLHLLTPEEVLAYLARQDPGRFLSAVLLGDAAAEDHELEIGRGHGHSLLIEAPKPGERYARSSLRVAAEQFVKRTGIRFETPPFVREATTQAEVDAVVQTCWKRLKEALRRGDIDAALEGVATDKRSQYRPVFQALRDNHANIDEVLTELHKVEIRDDSAEYEMLRVENGKALSYFVEFVRDGDGVWRLRAM